MEPNHRQDKLPALVKVDASHSLRHKSKPRSAEREEASESVGEQERE